MKEKIKEILLVLGITILTFLLFLLFSALMKYLRTDDEDILAENWRNEETFEAEFLNRCLLARQVYQYS